jgi:flagellar biosynthesis protein FliO
MNSFFAYAIAIVAAALTIYGAIRFFGRRSTPAPEEILEPASTREEGELEVLSRTRVGLGRSLVLVRFEGRRILLGVTKGQWTALADLGRSLPADQGPGSSIEAELNRALNADRQRRGRRNS